MNPPLRVAAAAVAIATQLSGCFPLFEAKVGADAASTRGVDRVVKLFEYVD